MSGINEKVFCPYYKHTFKAILQYEETQIMHFRSIYS